MRDLIIIRLGWKFMYITRLGIYVTYRHQTFPWNVQSSIWQSYMYVTRLDVSDMYMTVNCTWQGWLSVCKRVGCMWVLGVCDSPERVCMCNRVNCMWKGCVYLPGLGVCDRVQFSHNCELFRVIRTHNLNVWFIFRLLI